jgi:hypothetical protein
LTLQKKRVAALAFVSVVAYAGSTSAAPSYSIANVPSDIHPGAVFTVDVILDLDGHSSSGHEVSVRFTPGLLVAAEAAESGVPKYQLNLSPGVRGIDNAAGVVDQLEAAALTPTTPETRFVVGQITFQAGDVGRATIIGFFGAGAALLDDSGQAIDGVVFNGASVNVIPAPTPTPLTKAQQACVNEMNKYGEKVNKAQFKENERRLNDFQREKLVAPMTFDDCMTADRKDKVQKAE